MSTKIKLPDFSDYITIRVHKSVFYGGICALGGALMVLAIQSAANAPPPPGYRPVQV